MLYFAILYAVEAALSFDTIIYKERKTMLEKISHFYLSKKTFLIAIIATMILEPIGMIMLLVLGDIIPFELIAYGILFLLLIGLFITHHKKDYILMNGIISGILIYEFVRYVYLLTYYTNGDTLAYLQNAGFFIYFGYAFLFLAIAVVCLITYNHFTLNRIGGVNRIKIILNQFLLFISFFAPIVLIAMEYMIGDSVYEIVTYAVVGFSDAFLLLVVACCELELAINRRNTTASEDLVLSDAKSAIWYVFSFLFGLQCLIMAVLLPNAKTFVFVLSVIEILISVGLLIYYLNKKKKSSPKLRIYLNVGLITTIGLMLFFIACFIWTSLF